MLSRALTIKLDHASYGRVEEAGVWKAHTLRKGVVGTVKLTFNHF